MGTLQRAQRLWNHPHVAHVRHHSQRAWKRTQAINNTLAVRITTIVGSMWCAYLFALLALAGYPGAHATSAQLIQWVSQTFIQLVMLSILMVGQQVLGAKQEKHQQAVLARLEKMERQHGEELQALRTLVVELHSHTHCDGHTTIESE